MAHPWLPIREPPRSNWLYVYALHHLFGHCFLGFIPGLKTPRHSNWTRFLLAIFVFAVHAALKSTTALPISQLSPKDNLSLGIIEMHVVHFAALMMHHDPFFQLLER